MLCSLRFSTLKNTFTVSIISHCPNRFPKLLFYVFVLMEADVHFQLLNQFRLQIRSFQRIYLLHFMHLARCTKTRVTRKQYLWRVIGIVVVGIRVIRQPAVVSSQQWQNYPKVSLFGKQRKPILNWKTERSVATVHFPSICNARIEGIAIC